MAYLLIPSAKVKKNVAILLFNKNPIFLVNTLSPPPFYPTEQYRPGDHKLRIYRYILISFPFSLCLFSKCLFFHNSSPSFFSLTEMTSGVMAFLCFCGNSRGRGEGSDLWVDPCLSVERMFLVHLVPALSAGSHCWRFWRTCGLVSLGVV